MLLAGDRDRIRSESPRPDDSLAAMIEGLRTANPITLPSEFWTYLNELNLKQLETFGFDTFKRTVARNYFTWSVSPRDEQIRFLIRELPATSILMAAVKAIGAGIHPPMPLKLSLYYSFLSYLLWDYASRRQTAGKLLKELHEPREGSPPALTADGKVISQDLANSILELESIVDAGVDIRGLSTVMELGAGYGRTAFVFERLFRSVRYIIVDIPPALYVSQRYLSNQFRDRRIFRYRPFAAYDEIREEFERARIAFMLPSQIELLPAKSIDLFINISSFHEMRPHQIAYYFEQVARLARGYVYLKEWKRTTIPFDNVVLTESDYPVPREWRPVFWRTCQVQTKFFEALLAVA